ncbi:MAG: 16S rRNA (cytosine(1402)-N(4))-methyltransferase RsmH [Parcubacteria group bacterium]|nr:16S rRNA (cytosine(1402)-N(4))-methyltransferase RsmH [Parcubacteria group bacterium]
MHLPVLLNEVINYLDPQPNENFIDATCGEGGHSLAILEHNKPQGKVLGIETDSVLYQRLKEKKIPRLLLANDSYINLGKIVTANNFSPINGILFDLGMCSWHLDDSGRGFSYLKDEPLDMRFDINNNVTAAEIVNLWPSEDIEKIIKEYGEERYAKRIALAIKEARKKERIISTLQLVNILKRVLPPNYEHHRIHFATRTFQALRIAVNNELENLSLGLEEAIKIVSPQGRIVVISFHSLEDRIVKNLFRKYKEQNILKILTKKPVTPQKEEKEANLRSRSAKLRAALKI